MSGRNPGFLDAEQVRATVSMADAIDAVRKAFISHAAGEFELLPRSAMRDGAFLTMNAHHRASRTASVKAVSLDFDRRPAVQGVVSFLSLGDAPTVVMDAAAVTALRTGAVVGVATELLAPRDARVMTQIGLGGQAPDQIRAVRAVRDIRSVRLAGATPGEADGFHDRFADELADVEVVRCADTDDAVTGADIVCCATPSATPVFSAAALPERVHINAIGAFRLTMQELPADAFADALVVVDERAAALHEAGDVVHAISAGIVDVDSLVELGPALVSGVESRPRTVFKSVGLGIQDWAIARAVAERSSA
jgi:ornithine cyclodeaminase/alanine dehydrogenase-like protein (mu-crystallin family)